MKLVSAARKTRSHRNQRGYILLSLMLIITLMIIFAAVAASTMAFEIKREREEEMIHRGVQYSRAIRNYYKKFGRYPTRLEDLDNTNNLRYLRKHYKDPLNKNKDFKLLHYGDPGVTLTGSVGSTPIAGANTVGQLNAAGSGSAFGGGGSSFGQSSFGQSSSSFGQSSSSFGSGSNSGFGGNSGSSFGGSSSSFGGNSNSAFGSSNNSNSGSGNSSNGSSGNSSGSGDQASANGGTAQDPNAPQNGSTTSSGQGSNQVFGGGPIVGVASVSKETTIREYNKKKKYNEWQFVYDPTVDRGGLIMTPNQPALQIGTQNLNGQNGQPGQPGTNGSGSGFGSSGSSFGSGGSSFGQSSGFGNSNSGFGGSSNPPAPPPSSPNNN